MDALSFIGERPSPRRDDRVLRAAAFGLIPTAPVVATAALLVWRRSAGALTVPLDGPTAALCGLALASLDVAARTAARRMFAGYDVVLPGLLQIALNLAPLVRGAAIAVAAVALTLPGTKPASVALLWVPVAASLLIGAYRRFGARIDEQATSPRLMVHEPPVAPARRLRNQTTRFVDAAGRDVIEGAAVAEFAPGQRLVSLHLAFCPPFAQAPEIACGVASEAAAEVKVVQALAYAARFDVKLAAVAATPQEVPVSFSARCAE